MSTQELLALPSVGGSGAAGEMTGEQLDEEAILSRMSRRKADLGGQGHKSSSRLSQQCAFSTQVLQNKTSGTSSGDLSVSQKQPHQQAR